MDANLLRASRDVRFDLVSEVRREERDLRDAIPMQLIELRSGREGHPAYRAVAHELHAQIAAVHPRIAAAMKHVDRETEPRLERSLSEIRTQAKRAAAV